MDQMTDVLLCIWPALTIYLLNFKLLNRLSTQPFAAEVAHTHCIHNIEFTYKRVFCLSWSRAWQPFCPPATITIRLSRHEIQFIYM